MGVWCGRPRMDRIHAVEITLSGTKGKGMKSRVPAIVARQVRKYKWNISVQPTNRYAKTNGKGHLHRFVYGLLVKMGRKEPLTPGQVVDHIDRDGLNNTESNLRAATRSMNNQNAKKRTHSRPSKHTCDYVGVHYMNGKWRAMFKSAKLGTHRDPLVCACWYDHAVFREGLGGKTNFPEPNPLFPLSCAAIARLEAGPKRKTKSVRVDKCIIQHSKHGFSVQVGYNRIGTLPSLEEARIFRNLAKQEGAEMARRAINYIYY